MGACHLDHLVLAAATLEAGSRYLAGRLGVEPAGGGRHESMGTHNRLLRLGDRTYLELIAIDPAAPAPACRRWFDLDDPAMRRRIAAEPRLVAWVARTDELDGAMKRSPVDMGSARTMARGNFRWRIAVREDGSRPQEGIVPLLIQWEGAEHPADRLPASGCELVELEGHHPAPALAAEALDALGLRDVMKLSQSPGDPPRLCATVLTPRGRVRLG